MTMKECNVVDVANLVLIYSYYLRTILRPLNRRLQDENLRRLCTRTTGRPRSQYKENTRVFVIIVVSIAP